MVEAIATTKRKFYKALDSLNNTSTPRSNNEPATKRIRRSTSATSSVIRMKSTTTPSAISTPKQLPNFSPWSHETFLARLKTFSSVSLWHPKPEEINEVAWAKRGWVCVDVNTVACRGGCERRVLVDLDLPKRPSTADTESQDVSENSDDDQDEDNEAMESALVDRYKALIVESHAATCMWKKAGCKDDIYRLQVIQPLRWQPDLKRRYHSLVEISSAIAHVALETCDNSNATDHAMLHLPNELLGENPDPKAYRIALYGWRGTVDAHNELLHCDACFQRVGLWMYQPGYKSSRAEAMADDHNETTLDLLELHRDHCPWRNPAAQKASGSFSGLSASQILQRVVLTYIREHRRLSEQEKPSHEFDINEDRYVADEPTLPTLSREEVAKQDKERESRLKKLKGLFNIKRRSMGKPASAISSAQKQNDTSCK